MRRSSVVVLCAVLAGCAAPASAPSPSRTAAQSPDVRTVAATYRALRAMTPEPVLVDPGLAMLCRGVTAADVRKAREASGPHVHSVVSIYMNDAAVGAFGKPDARYPAGSIIVKQKRSQPYLSASDSPGATSDHDGVGGMIKRSPGYDPDHGDWEYFYFENPARIESGRIASCIACHAGAMAKDYVFGDWARGTRPR